MMLWKCTQYASKFGKLSSATGLEKVSFHSNPKEGWCQKNVQTMTQLHSFHMLAKKCTKSFKIGFSSMWTVNFQMCKLDLEGRGTRDQLASICCWWIARQFKSSYTTFPYHQQCLMVSVSLHLHKSVLYVFVSFGALQIGSSVLSFQIPCICVNMWYLLFSFWLNFTQYPWRREWLPTPVSWSGEFRHKSQTQLSNFHFSFDIIGSRFIHLFRIDSNVFLFIAE